MIPEAGLSKIMRTGLLCGMFFMLVGVVCSFFGNYSEDVRLSFENLMNGTLFLDGAGLLYIGTVFIICTPAAVLLYLAAYYFYAKPVKYAVYCLMILVFLIIVVLSRV